MWQPFRRAVLEFSSEKPQHDALLASLSPIALPLLLWAQMELGRGLDFNHELRTVGISNLVSGLTGGYVRTYVYACVHMCVHGAETK
jgi:hypothetical protein